MTQATTKQDPDLVPARFSIHTVDKVFDGFHYGDNWNGWACPYFSLETAREIMRDVEANDPEQRWWETETAIVTQHECDDEPMEFPKKIINVGGVAHTIVAVGSGFWVWDLVE